LTFVSISSLTLSEARSVSPVNIKVEETVIGEIWIEPENFSLPFVVISQGEKIEIPLKVTTSKPPMDVEFRSTIGIQLAPPKMPKGVEITFDPNPLILTTNETKTIVMIVQVDENAPSSKYLTGIIFEWEKPNGWTATNFSLHIGKNYGTKAISINTLAPPLKYYKLDVKAEEIPCRLDYVLIIKDSNGFPACVKPTSVEKLIERGWAKSE